jgi:3-hydroxyisobutyrate dehydrogenase
VRWERRRSRSQGVQQVRRASARVSSALTLSLILAINQIALAEGLALGKSLGIEPLLLHNVINSSSGRLQS